MENCAREPEVTDLAKMLTSMVRALKAQAQRRFASRGQNGCMEPSIAFIQIASKPAHSWSPRRLPAAS